MFYTLFREMHIQTIFSQMFVELLSKVCSVLALVFHITSAWMNAETSIDNKFELFKLADDRFEW